MSQEFDSAQYLDLFVQEADEQLAVLEQEALKLESDPTDERMQAIFRAAHTLKGSSRAMGFANFAGLTHEMENLLDQLRSHRLSVNGEIADALLACVDALGQMASSIRSGGNDEIDCTELVATLRTLTGSSPENQPEPQGAEQYRWESKIPEEQFEAISAAAAQTPVYHANLRLSADCVMKFVRVYMAVSVVQESGQLLLTCPEFDALEEERFDRDFELVFQTSAPLEDIKKRLLGISEIDEARVEEWSEDFVRGAPSEGKAKTPKIPEHSAPDSKPRRGDTGQTVRVDVARLDNLMDLVGELVIDRTRVAQLGSDLNQKCRDARVEELEETVGHIARITTDLQDQIMKVRMMPIETVFSRIPRVVRDLAKKLGKEIDLKIVGGDTELDRSVIEIIGDPILHILRNSVDHGIETPEDRQRAGKPRAGSLVVSARHQENHIVIEVVDDGKGIDAKRIRDKAVESGLLSKEEAKETSDKDALKFIYASGLSTAEQVSEVSGRGVGMDIVRSNILSVGGIVDLDSALGEGTKFSIRLPLTLAIIRGLLVKVRHNDYVLPLQSVVETLIIKRDQVQSVSGTPTILIRGTATPLLDMRCALWPGEGQTLAERPEEKIYVVVVGMAHHRVGLVVDGLVGEQEVVIKSLSRFCGDTPGVNGATILGNGKVALIVDVNGITAAA